MRRIHDRDRAIPPAKSDFQCENVPPSGGHHLLAAEPPFWRQEPEQPF